MDKVVVGLSGGVDSSLALALLREGGAEVSGATLVLWTCDSNRNDSSCCTMESVNDARQVALDMGVNHKVIDATDLFKETVIKHTLDVYEAGGTPTPCVMCNQFTKFAPILEKMDVPYLATGHYARTMNIDGQIHLLRSTNEKKDQSYYLYRVPDDVLSRLVFPLGNFRNKEDVRREAQKRNIITHKKPDSMDLCFLPRDGGIRRFLADWRGLLGEPGDVRHMNTNEVIGKHQGIWGVVVGTRKGLTWNNPTSERMYVGKVDVKTNTVWVGDSEEIKVSKVFVGNTVWRGEKKSGMEVLVQTRYHGTPVSAMVEFVGDGIVFHLSESTLASPGQHAVAYDTYNKICYGGGMICK